MRTAEIKRSTAETDISLYINLDGKGEANVSSGVGFLDHMLTLFARHSGFDLSVTCKGDTEVDFHHSVEDIGIALGQAFNSAVGDKKGIRRYGEAIIPMDEALIMTAVDISGRAFFGYGLEIPAEKVGDFDTELCEEFFAAFVREARVALHIRQLAGKNSHHIIEGAFKSAARSLRAATETDQRFSDLVPSTKGAL